MPHPRLVSLVPAAGALLGGCAAIDTMTGTWHAPDEGAIAHVTVVAPGHGGGQLYFCADDGWRTVDGDTDVPALRTLKVKAYAAGDPHLHHGVEHRERECIENLEFRPENNDRYRIVWNTQASSCALIVLRRQPGGLPAGSSGQPGDEWLQDASVRGADGYCAGKH